MHSPDFFAPNSTCTFDTWEPWTAGAGFYRSLRETSFSGASGDWDFNEGGLTRRVEYEIVNFRSEGYDSPTFHEIGKWSSKAGLKISPQVPVKFFGGLVKPAGLPSHLNGIHLKLGVTSNPPFARQVPNCTHAVDCWEGICPDVVKNLSRALNFSYEYVQPLDTEFGIYYPQTDSWTGLIGDLLAQRTDMIAMDLSVGVQRKSYIDFTVSFMDSGISLAVKGESGKNNLFFFLSPFGYSVWAMMIVAFIFMGVILNLLNKLSPYGCYGRKVSAMQLCPCEGCTDRRLAKQQFRIAFRAHYKAECLLERAESDVKERDMTFYNSLWVAGAGLVGQGGGALPTSPSGRFILFVWWFFVLLIISMYTANLTAFMTLDKIGITVDSAKELIKANKKKYDWGILRGSFVESLLKNNIDPDFKKLVEMAVKVDSVEEGNQRVLGGGFVFIDETPFLRYNLLGSCNIFQVGPEIQPFDYGFGLPKNSPYTELMNTELIKYRLVRLSSPFLVCR